ncbi:HAAS signaling domain-containing protein [Georgenia subflava]|uniref:DUF1700 domain-containing protein n=1 Tax=Georgenia subflava TaxID=1622177 RepID=A0A6N7EI68_9MICO|nr:hypothetical protein [Georgenia subflava]MPV37829.1 hypothetical protein [Georgenia subflava]
MNRLPVRDVVRREAFLARLSLWLDDYPAREQKSLLAQLRGELDLAAADSSMRSAVSAMGSPRELAREYRATLPAGRPRWAAGGFWVSIGLIVWLVLFVTFVAALLQVAAAGGPDGVTAQLLWAEVTAVDTPEEISLVVSGTWVGLALLAVVFLVGSRAWRVLRRRDRADAAV